MVAASQWFLLHPVGVANLATRCGEAALAPPLGELLSEREAEGVYFVGCCRLTVSTTPSRGGS